MQSAKGGDSAVRPTEMEGMRAAYWSKAGYEFILIGGQDAELIARVAAVYSDRISRSGHLVGQLTGAGRAAEARDIDLDLEDEQQTASEATRA